MTGSRATTDELNAALSHVLAAPGDGARVEMLCLRPDYGQRRFVPEISVTRERGIPGERWASRPWLRLPDGQPHPGIQICILSRRVLDLVWRERERTVHPGDTFIADMDLSEYNVPAGQHLRVGSAVLEVSDIFNDACVKWSARYGRPSRDWINRPENRALRLRGLLCRVVQDGRICNGDRMLKCASPAAPRGVDRQQVQG